MGKQSAWVWVVLALASCAKSHPLAATGQRGSSPADGPAVYVSVPALGLRISLYEPAHLRAFEAGELVKVPLLEGAGTKSEATQTDQKGFVFVAAELQVDPKSNDGLVAISGGTKQTLHLEWLPTSGR